MQSVHLPRGDNQNVLILPLWFISGDSGLREPDFLAAWIVGFSVKFQVSFFVTQITRREFLVNPNTQPEEGQQYKDKVIILRN